MLGPAATVFAMPFMRVVGQQEGASVTDFSLRRVHNGRHAAETRLEAPTGRRGGQLLGVRLRAGEEIQREPW